MSNTSPSDDRGAATQTFVGPRDSTETYLPPASNSGVPFVTQFPDAGVPIEWDDLPDYRIEEKLGGGGTGDVYLASHRTLAGSRFAIKFLRANRMDAAQIERFKREARAMIELRHPNIVTFRHFGEHRGTLYLVMEYMEGGPLTARMGDYLDNARSAVSMLIKIADAVDYMHLADIIHRDLKPGNILIDKAGEPYLADFGLAKLGDSPGEQVSTISPRETTDIADRETRVEAPESPPGDLTRAGTVMGTLAYMPPEQLLGQQDRIGRTADVWALGVILFELMTGRKPFIADTPEDLCRLIDGAEPPKPSDLKPELKGTLDRIVSRCITKDAADRYPTAAALVHDLRRWLHPPWYAQRRFQIGGVAMITLAIAVTVAIWPNPPVPEPPKPTRAELMAKVNERLRIGETVNLIRDDGTLEVPWEVLVGADSTRIEQGVGNRWDVHAADLSLIEFLKHIDIDNYKFIVELRPVKQTKVPEVGIYASHQLIQNPTGDQRLLIDLSYREASDNFLPAVPNNAPFQLPPGVKGVVGRRVGDAKPDPGKGQTTIRLSTYKENDAGKLPGKLSEWEITPTKAEREGPWRELEFWAKKDDFFLYFGGEMKYHLKPDEQKRRFRPAIMFHPPDAEPLPQRLSANGGIGLVIKGGGSVAIRSIQIVPIFEP